MDVEFKVPKLENFISSSQRPQSISPVWSDKDKPEEDADALVSDGDDQDQGSAQRIDENSNGCIENYGDALEWNNGIGTLAGSELKFRMNEHGDIEVIMETLEQENEMASDFSLPSADCSMRPSESGDEPPQGCGTTGVPVDMENRLAMLGMDQSDMPVLEKLMSENGQSLDLRNCMDDSEIKAETENDLEEQRDCGGVSNAVQEDVKTHLHMEDAAAADDTEITKQVSTNQDQDSPTSSVDQAILDDYLPEYDPVLSEDMASMLYENGKDIDCSSSSGITVGEEPAVILGKDESATCKSLVGGEDHTTVTPSKCIICGKPSRLANRFCSRQCLGKNAAIRRRANQLGTGSKKAKVLKRKSNGRGRHHHFPDHVKAPHPNDVLTVVKDESAGERNNLKIKIRWSSSASNGNNGEDYFPEPREASKRKAAAAAVNYAGPKVSRRKKFSWISYLAEQNATAVPIDAFEDLTRRDPFPRENPFQVGMALEGVDPEHESLFCSLFVAEVRGCRVRLSFCGYSEAHDFWTNADSPLLFPCGFCEQTSRTLQPPRGYAEKEFDWADYTIENRLVPAPKELFLQSTGQKNFPKFVIGQKLEAVDKHNPDLVCVATIHDVVDDRVLVHFDGWSHNFDYWCVATSQHLRPAGWCKAQGRELTTPPKDSNESKKFSWDRYLVETGSIAADARIFSASDRSHKFETGMKLEVVDPRNKIVVRVATIAEVNGFNVKIHFDGWSDMYDFWTHIENEDLHPSGWCHVTGHLLQPPIALDEMSDSSWQQGACPIPCCSGIGHIQGAKYQNHYSEFGCPYSPQNLTKEHVKDRLVAFKPRRNTASAQNGEFQMHDEGDPDFTRPQLPARAAKVVGKRRIGSFSNSYSEGRRMRSSLENNCEYPYAKKLRKASQVHSVDAVSRWTVEEVAKYVGEITSEPLHGKAFVREDIDGRAMLMLAQSDLLRVLNIKLGPAVKIYHAILNIKEVA